MATEESTKSIYFSENVLKTRLRSSSIQKSSRDISVGYKRPKLCTEVKRSASGNDDNPIPELTVGLQRYQDEFYNIPCKDLAKRLLGKVLVRRLSDDIVLKGRIVETECYLGGEDKASHSYAGKVTERNKPMYMKPGTAYVYFTYGMYHCFNISSQEPGACVLIRSVEPLEGLAEMCRLRKAKKMRKQENSTTPGCDAKDLKNAEICNGPSKLCISFDIRKENCNAKDLCRWDGMWIEEGGVKEDLKLDNIVSCPRIGIDSAGEEWAQKPLRFYVISNKFVSRRNTLIEKQHSELVNISGSH